jgi:large repetitive protein
MDTYKIWIYDTWGNLMWYSDKLIGGSPAEGWDGTYNGVVAKMDSYIWKIEATFADGTSWEGQGSSNSDKKKTMGNVLLLR